MLRLVALLAGLVLLALLAFVFLQRRPAAPVSTPTEAAFARQEDRRADPLSSVETAARDEAGEPATPDANYVGIVGELTREEDGTPVEGAVVTFAYRYLSKGPQAVLRKVPVDVDERGHFEQLFSEPVQLASCLIQPVELESPELQHDSVRRADFLQVERPLDVRVDVRGVHVTLVVTAGLEITGRVFDALTNESQAGALVFAHVDFELTLGVRTNSSGIFRMRGIDPVLAQPGRDYVARSRDGPDFFSSIPKLSVNAAAAAHRPGSTFIPLPLSASRPTRADIAVASGIRVAGKVLDFSGKPVPKARVDVTVPADPQSEDSHEPVRVQGTLTDEDGQFVFESVELAEGCEIRAQHPWQTGPAPHVALGDRRSSRPAIVLSLPDTQGYRIQLRDTDGTLIAANYLSVSLRDVWGERTVNGGLQVWAAVGARTQVVVSTERIVDGKSMMRHARTVLEPLVQTPEPETLTLDLEP